MGRLSTSPRRDGRKSFCWGAWPLLRRSSSLSSSLKYLKLRNILVQLYTNMEGPSHKYQRTVEVTATRIDCYCDKSSLPLKVIPTRLPYYLFILNFAYGLL